MEEISIVWFRRDLRLFDNAALYHALNSPYRVLPVFIFDYGIVDELQDDDPRISFIYKQLNAINSELRKLGSGLKILKGNVRQEWERLLNAYSIKNVFYNVDYEPYARKRDAEIKTLLKSKRVAVQQFKDQVIFDTKEVLKNDGSPYTIYTPYMKKWRSLFNNQSTFDVQLSKDRLFPINEEFPDLTALGFKSSNVEIRDFSLDNLDQYAEVRDVPHFDSTSYLGPHLRFGTVSVRALVNQFIHKVDVFVNELIWREFFMQILYHYPHVVDQNFKPKYNGIDWRNNEGEFIRWCNGETGYPMVDAGMRQLNQTGYMHNRVRMITAGFLTKHLLIDWRWGEAYFAKKLNDYELASNNGNWQWAAGTGCDAAPYFRIFNPIEQQRKFDKDLTYVKRWVPEIGKRSYPLPMVEHKLARARALDTYQKGILKSV